MNYKRIEYSDHSYMDCYLQESFEFDVVGRVNKEHPAIIVCPGGGFNDISASEADPVAMTFLKDGFSTFVLHYSTGEHCNWQDLQYEMQKAIWDVRSNAKEWHINPNAIAVMGFSAGGGMVSMAACQWKMNDMYKKVGAPTPESVRPDAAIMAYADDHIAQITRQGLIDMGDEEAKNKTDEDYSILNLADKDTPPIFIRYTRIDPASETSFSVDVARKLAELEVPYELHVFNNGGHGMSVFNRCSDSDNYDSRQYRTIGMWVDMCTDWLFWHFGY